METPRNTANKKEVDLTGSATPFTQSASARRIILARNATNIASQARAPGTVRVPTMVDASATSIITDR